MDNPEFDKKAYDAIIRSMEFAAIMGVRNIIVHPKQHFTYIYGENPRILRDINLEFYNSLIPYCKDFNITVCLENMWQFDSERKITPSTCSCLQEFNEYIDLIDSPYIQGCLDIGHAIIAKENVAEFIRGIGKRLKALHVHDTMGDWDAHRVPFTLNHFSYWQEIMTALKDAGYEGELTFEADNTLKLVPDSLLIPTAEYMVKIGRTLIDMFEKST
jgi:sugar phosphate isomerase/epimerase